MLNSSREVLADGLEAVLVGDVLHGVDLAGWNGVVIVQALS